MPCAARFCGRDGEAAGWVGDPYPWAAATCHQGGLGEPLCPRGPPQVSGSSQFRPCESGFHVLKHLGAVPAALDREGLPWGEAIPPTLEGGQGALNLQALPGAQARPQPGGGGTGPQGLLPPGILPKGAPTLGPAAPAELAPS